MSQILAFLRAFWTTVAVFLYVFVIGTPVLLYSHLTRRLPPLLQVARWGCRLGLWLAGIKLDIRGQENLSSPRPCIFMANHQSNIDPPLLFWVIPPPIALMGKKQVFSLPVIGSAMKLANFVRVDREDPEAAKASVEVALEHLRQGTSFLVYPEGTRSRDGRLQRFKHGVFVLAIRGQVPIVPITLDGCETLMPKGKRQIHPGTVRVTIHVPVETRGLTIDDREQLAHRVRSIVASALPEEKRSVAEMMSERAGTIEGNLAL